MGVIAGGVHVEAIICVIILFRLKCIEKRILSVVTESIQRFPSHWAIISSGSFALHRSLIDGFNVTQTALFDFSNPSLEDVSGSLSGLRSMTL